MLTKHFVRCLWKQCLWKRCFWKRCVWKRCCYHDLHRSTLKRLENHRLGGRDEYGRCNSEKELTHFSDSGTKSLKARWRWNIHYISVKRSTSKNIIHTQINKSAFTSSTLGMLTLPMFERNEKPGIAHPFACFRCRLLGEGLACRFPLLASIWGPFSVRVRIRRGGRRFRGKSEKDVKRTTVATGNKARF